MQKSLKRISLLAITSGSFGTGGWQSQLGILKYKEDANITLEK